MSQSYLPRQEGNKLTWLQNFSSKLETYAAKYDLSAGEISDVQTGIIAYSYWVDYAMKQSEYAKKLNLFKTELANGTSGTLTLPEVPVIAVAPALPTVAVLKRVASIVAGIKSKPVYAKNDGLDLGIETAATSSVDVSTLKPLISVQIVSGGYPEIQWKKGANEGVEIQVDKGNNTWQFLGVDLKPNYTDSTPLPSSGSSEVRRYRAIYIDDDNHIGLWSDAVEIAVAGF